MFRPKKHSFENFCPFIQDECLGEQCALHVTVKGRDPQTNEPVNSSQCALVWFPVLQIETSKEVRCSSASIDNLRNENERRHMWWVQILDRLNIGKPESLP